MILGMTLSTFTLVHVVISLKVGILSLLVLAVAIIARYVFQLAAGWRGIYVVSAVVALYLNGFVLVVQLFEKVAALRAMAPTQKEPPFLVAQLVILALFVALTIIAAKRFRMAPGSARLNRGCFLFTPRSYADITASRSAAAPPPRP